MAGPLKPPVRAGTSRVYGKDSRREYRNCPREEEWFPEIVRPIRAGVLDRSDARAARRSEQLLSIKSDIFGRPKRRYVPEPLPTEGELLGAIDYTDVESRRRDGSGGWTVAELDSEAVRLAAMEARAEALAVDDSRGYTEEWLERTAL